MDNPCLAFGLSFNAVSFGEPPLTTATLKDYVLRLPRQCLSPERLLRVYTNSIPCPIFFIRPWDSSGSVCVSFAHCCKCFLASSPKIVCLRLGSPEADTGGRSACRWFYKKVFPGEREWGGAEQVQRRKMSKGVISDEARPDFVESSESYTSYFSQPKSKELELHW